MEIPENIFKSYDIRGIYPSELNEKNAAYITRAIIQFIRDEAKTQTPLSVALGCDMRLSSPSLFNVVKAILLDLGINVYEVGLSSTPTLYFATRHFGADAGIQISASHNPKNYNGLKIVKNSSSGLIKIGKTTGMDEIKRLSLALAQDSGPLRKTVMSGTVHTVDQRSLLSEEIKLAKKITGNPEIKSFKIVADVANSMGAPYLEALFREIPGELVKMNFTLDGNFPSHPADPLVEANLEDLKKKVASEKADLGLAPDGDGDRLMFIDEKSTLVKPSTITALIAKELLKQNPGEKILFDIRYVFTPKKIIEEHGGVGVESKVGHAFITEQLGQVGGIFAGESSGHYFFRETGNAESQLPVILLVLKVMTRENKPLSIIAKDLSRSVESGEINFKVKNSQALMKILEDHFKEGHISKIDGIALSFPDWRFSLRSSNTEPLLRLNVEELLPGSKGENLNKVITLIKTHGQFEQD